MLPVSDWEIEQIRAALNDLMPDTCTLLTETRVSDGAGGWSSTWGTAAASVACRFDPLNGSEQLAGGAVQPFQGYRLTLPADTTITTAYRVQKGGVTYNVISVDTGKSWAGSVRAVVQAI